MELADRLSEALGDSYRIEREIGSGGMATVFLAHDLKHDREVALKVLRDQVAQSVGAERFLQEIRIVAKLHHPHVLTLLDSGEVEGTLYYVMPYIEGESLREKLEREHELPVPDALRLLREVADALAFAHAKGVVHRDIKPDNVLVAGRHAVVADFGVSKALSAATGENKVTTLGVALGTPSYMAPEQAAADATIDHRADIYALGILGYELLTGRPPFTGSTPQQILGAQVTESPRTVTEIRPAVPEAVSAVLMRCLEKRPADRWQTAEELRAQFEALQTSSGGITPTGMMPVARPGRPKWVLGVAAVLVVAAVGIGAWMVAGGGGGEGDTENAASSSSAASSDAAGAGAAEVDRGARVVVLPLENLTGAASLDPLGRQGASAVERAVSQSDAAEVVPLQSLAGEVEGVPTAEVAEEARAGLVVTGEYYARGDELEFVAHLLDPIGERTLYDLRSVRGSPDDPTTALQALADRVAAAIATYRWGNGVFLMEYLSPPPGMEVYRLFTEMMQLQGRLAYQEALDRSRRIQQIDTTWLTYKTWEQAILGAMGRSAEADSLWRFLDARRDRLTEAEGLRADRLHATQVGDPEEAYRKSRALEELGVMYNPYNSTLACSATNRLEEALVHLDRFWEAFAGMTQESAGLPEGGLVVFQVRWRILARMGRLEEALDVAKAAKSGYPAETAPLGWEATTLAALGRSEDVVALLEEARALPASAGDWSPAEPLRLATRAAVGTGRTEDAARYADLALEETAGTPGDTRYFRARMLAYVGRWAEAEPLFRELLDENPDSLPYLGYLGWILGSQGKAGEAGEMRDRIGGLGLVYRERGTGYYWQAAISTALGEHDRALRELQDAYSTGQGFGTWTMWDPWFHPLHDDPRYQRWVAPK